MVLDRESDATTCHRQHDCQWYRGIAMGVWPQAQLDEARTDGADLLGVGPTANRNRCWLCISISRSAEPCSLRRCVLSEVSGEEGSRTLDTQVTGARVRIDCALPQPSLTGQMHLAQ